MIKNIFLDIDETLAHTMLGNPNQDHRSFILQNDETYFTIFHPQAKDVIDYSRECVGYDNVYLLTTSISDYAQKINEIGEWGFEKDHIIPREIINSHTTQEAYGESGICKHVLYDLNNVLVDNLPFSYNNKCGMMGITEKNYLKVRDYYGTNLAYNPFFDNFKEFINERL